MIRRASWPKAQAASGWDEYDATGVLTRMVPALAARDERIAALLCGFEAAKGTAEQNRYFQRMFEVVMGEWLVDGSGMDGVEGFEAFQRRVQATLDALMRAATSRRVVVFTSGGPIGLLMQHVLRAPVQSFLDVNWRVRNCSITEFVFGGGRISLDSFNGVLHMEPSLWSFR